MIQVQDPQNHTLPCGTYRKIPQISPGDLYFSKALFEGLTFGGAYVWREICMLKSIGLALFLEGNLPFFFVLPCIWGQFPSSSPRGGGGFELGLPGGEGGAYIWRGVSTKGFLRYDFIGLIHGGAYFRNFTGLPIVTPLRRLSQIKEAAILNKSRP